MFVEVCANILVLIYVFPKMIQTKTRSDFIIHYLNMQESVDLEIGQDGGKNFWIESSVEVQHIEELNNESFPMCVHTELMLNL